MVNNPHSEYDTLERLDDLLAIQDLLLHIRNRFDKKVKITANFITCNPNFSEISSSNFNEYFFEPFVDTYFNRDHNTKVFDKVKELIREGYFTPQFHGREHVNVIYWLNELRLQNKDLLSAFRDRCYALDTHSVTRKKPYLMAAYEYHTDIERNFVKNSIVEGTKIFNDIFGHTSKSTVAPKHIWNPQLNKTFSECGIQFIQTAINQYVPTIESYLKIRHFTGEVDKDGLLYLVRNLYFEPSYAQDINWVDKSFGRIKWLFKLNVPVIISM
ncbi:MAG: hypothetical protein EOO43_17420, partial [Flavobacterium sp.]